MQTHSAYPRIGRFDVVRMLGLGGMAELFHALDGDAEVAIKRVLPFMAGRHDILSMFRDEARLAARLRHPNLVRATAIGEADGLPYYAMELVRGIDVARLLKTTAKGGFALDHALTIVCAAARALHYAHELCDEDGLSLDVVHRDVSPSNVLITFEGVVKVIDFGIAKAHGRTSETCVGMVKGKTGYMAPEQVTGGAIDRRTDVFGLGILLFELTTGTRLYRAKHDYDLLIEAGRADIPPPGLRRSSYTGDLSRIVLRALAKDPDDRYATAEELAQAIEDWAARTGLSLSAAAMGHALIQLFPADASAARREGALPAQAPVERGGRGTPLIAPRIATRDSDATLVHTRAPSEVKPSSIPTVCHKARPQPQPRQATELQWHCEQRQLPATQMIPRVLPERPARPLAAGTGTGPTSAAGAEVDAEDELLVSTAEALDAVDPDRRPSWGWRLLRGVVWVSLLLGVTTLPG